MLLLFSNHKTICKVMGLITSIVVMKERIRNYFCSFFPSYVNKIVHFDTKCAKIDTLYVAKKNMYSLTKGHTNLVDIPDTGYYMFHVWNSKKVMYEYYLLKANIVVNALGTKDLTNIWAFHDYGMIKLLSTFVDYNNFGFNKKMVGISLNNVDESKILKPFFGSIYIKNNVTPFVLFMLTKYMRYEKFFYIDAKNTSCIYSDEDLNDICINNAYDYVFPTKEYRECNKDIEIEELFEDPSESENKKDKDA